MKRVLYRPGRRLHRWIAIKERRLFQELYNFRVPIRRHKMSRGKARCGPSLPHANAQSALKARFAKRYKMFFPASTAEYRTERGIPQCRVVSPENLGPPYHDVMIPLFCESKNYRTGPLTGHFAAQGERLQREKPVRLASLPAPKGPPCACRCCQTVPGFGTFRFAAFCRARCRTLRDC
jgi:hypothetical protein